jgi:hypothetical protein
MRKGNQILTALSSTVFSCGLFTRLVVSVLVIGIIYVDLHENGNQIFLFGCSVSHCF